MEEEESGARHSIVIYSPEYTYSGKSCCYSPDGQYLLFSNGKEVEILTVTDQVIRFTLYCSDRVDYAEWSPDSSHILCSRCFPCKTCLGTWLFVMMILPF